MVYIEFYPQVHLLLRNSRTLWIRIFIIIIIQAGCYGGLTVLFPICNILPLSYNRLASNLASYSLCKVSWVYTQPNLPMDRAVVCLSLLHTDAYRGHCVYNSGTNMLKRHATSVVSCMVILDDTRCNNRQFSHFNIFLSI